MATYSTNVTDPTALTAGETVTINSGVTVTITNGQWSALGAGNITNNGTLVFRNESSSDGWKFCFATASAYMSGTGSLIIEGDWISIDTGTGGTFTLNGSHTSSVTTITVNQDTSDAASSGQLLIGSEYISYTGKTQYTFTGCTRGKGGTLAAAYTTGTSVAQANSGQTSTHWDADYCPCVWVETAAGSGVYDRYLNLTGGSATHSTVTGLSFVGAGKYGRFFTQSGATLTFGDGINGKCPPAGANIRIPNIILTHLAAISTGICYVSGGYVSGYHRRAQFSRVTYNGAGIISASTVESCSFPARIYTRYQSTLTDVAISPSGGETNQTNSGFNLTNQTAVTNCSAWTASTATIATMSSGRHVFTNCEMMQIDASTTDVATVIATATTGKVVIRGGLYVGSIYFGATGVSVDIDGPEISEGLLLNNSNTAANKAAIIIGGTGAYSYPAISIANVYVPDGGNFTGGFFALLSSATGAVTVYSLAISNINLPGSSRWAAFFNVIAAYTVTVLEGKLYDVSTGFPTLKTGNTLAVAYTDFKDISMLGTAVNNIFAVVGHSNTFKNMSGTQLSGIAAGWVDNFFYSYYTGTSTGYLTWQGCPVTARFSAYRSFSGGAYYDNDYRYYSPNGGSFILETPYLIRGVTGFTGAIVGGVNYDTYNTIEYCLDTGSGYGAWQTASSANLTAETVSATTGFRMKVRCTYASAGTNNTAYIYVPCNFDRSVKYASTQVNLVLNNIVTGSQYTIFKSSDGTVISSGTAASSTVTVSNIDYYSDVNVTIRVRKGTSSQKYFPFETGGTITSVGMNVWVAQIADTIAA